MIVENVDFQITSMCNRKCKYCFGPKNIESLPLDDILNILLFLVSNGTKQIGITGGEPLCHPFITDIIDYAYDLGLKIYLSTNCDFYFRYTHLIKDKVSIIGIPLDGPNAQIHNFHRGNNSFQNIYKVIKDIHNDDNTSIKIKFGTVITKNNYNYLPEIEQLISPYKNIIVFWKLYELITYDRNKLQTNALKYHSLIPFDNLGKYLPKNKIIYNQIEDRTLSYFFIAPNGNVFVPNLKKDISKEFFIGNIIKDNYKDIISSFEKIVNLNGYYSKFRYMMNDSRSAL